MIDATLFKARFLEFNSVTDARINLFIADAVAILNEPYWDEKYNLGLYYLTAHYLALALKSEAGSVTGAGGAVNNRTVDGVSISYSNATPDDQTDAYYASTSYGSRYIALRNSLGVASASV